MASPRYTRSTTFKPLRAAATRPALDTPPSLATGTKGNHGERGVPGSCPEEDHSSKFSSCLTPVPPAPLLGALGGIQPALFPSINVPSSSPLAQQLPAPAQLRSSCPAPLSIWGRSLLTCRHTPWRTRRRRPPASQHRWRRGCGRTRPRGTARCPRWPPGSARGTCHMQYRWYTQQYRRYMDGTGGCTGSTLHNVRQYRQYRAEREAVGFGRRRGGTCCQCPLDQSSP